MSDVLKTGCCEGDESDKELTLVDGRVKKTYQDSSTPSYEVVSLIHQPSTYTEWRSFSTWDFSGGPPPTGHEKVSCPVRLHSQEVVHIVSISGILCLNQSAEVAAHGSAEMMPLAQNKTSCDRYVVKDRTTKSVLHSSSPHLRSGE